MLGKQCQAVGVVGLLVLVFVAVVGHRGSSRAAAGAVAAASGPAPQQHPGALSHGLGSDHASNHDGGGPVENLGALNRERRGNDDGQSRQPRYAYVTIHYEGTPADAEYVLGIRVLIQSLQPLRHPFIILVSDSVTQASRDLFAAEGATIVEVPNVENPFANVLPRFVFTFNKLHLWNMTEFDRIVYFDADNIAIHTDLVDDLFKCGHFCVLYMNPCHFHTGVMVVKPDETKYNELLAGLHGTGSYDGADQGFLSKFFESCADAPMFDPTQGISEEPLNQLPLPYNMHALYYLLRYDFEPYRCGAFEHAPGLPVATLGFPVPPVIKPWYWWTTLFGHTALWDQVRARLDEPGLMPSFFARLAVAVVGLGFALYAEKRLAANQSLVGSGSTGSTIPGAVAAAVGANVAGGGSSSNLGVPSSGVNDGGDNGSAGSAVGGVGGVDGAGGGVGVDVDGGGDVDVDVVGMGVANGNGGDGGAKHPLQRGGSSLSLSSATGSVTSVSSMGGGGGNGVGGFGGLGAAGGGVGASTNGAVSAGVVDSSAILGRFHRLLCRLGPQPSAVILGATMALLCFKLSFAFVPYTYPPWMGVTLYVTCHLGLLLAFARLIAVHLLLLGSKNHRHHLLHHHHRTSASAAAAASAGHLAVPASELAMPLVAFAFLFGAQWIDPALSVLLGPGLHNKIITLILGFLSVLTTQVNLFVHITHHSPLFPHHR